MTSPATPIAQLACGDRMKRALVLVADGLPYRDAARKVGYRDHREVYRWAKRAGLLETHTVQLVATYRRIADLANTELERRLVEQPEKVMMRDLTVVSGVAADKIAKLGMREDAGAGDRVVHVLERLQEAGGGTVGVTIEVASSQGVLGQLQARKGSLPDPTIEIAGAEDE